jgi:hypothetical protein
VTALQPVSCPDCLLAHAGERQLCEPCFEDYLHGLERGFLENYAEFGVRQRQVVAESLLRALVLADARDRKLLAMTIVEQLINATSDVIGLYAAIRNRDAAPLIQGFLQYELASTVTDEFFELLVEGGDFEVLTALGLPHPDRLLNTYPAMPYRRAREVAEATLNVLEGLDKFARNAPATRIALLQAQSERSRGLTLTDRMSWLQGPALRADQVAALTVDLRARRLVASPLAVDENSLGEITSAIGDLTGVARDMIFAYLAIGEVDGHAPRGG